VLREINIDGIIGPSHNYAGLSLGNIASSSNAGAVSQPRAAALQGVEKMRANLRLGLAQGFFMPLDRPNTAWPCGLAADMATPRPHIPRATFSAPAPWRPRAERGSGEGPEATRKRVGRNRDAKRDGRRSEADPPEPCGREARASISSHSRRCRRSHGTSVNGTGARGERRAHVMTATGTHSGPAPLVTGRPWLLPS